MQFYRISGLLVGSDIILPGMIAQADADRPEVTIRRGAVPLTLENPSSSAPTWAIAGEQMLLRIPDIARFLLTAGNSIVFEPETEQSDADIAIFVLGAAFGILLHQREQIVLHASAVRVNDKAVLFCGPSGAGKSTLAAALIKAGYPMLTDDVCAIGLTPDGPMVYPDGRRLKLWAHSIQHLDLAQSRGERVRTQLEKFYVEPAASFDEPLPLGALYALREARPPHRPGIERPNVVDAALVLRRNAYRPLLVRRMDQKAQYFLAATAIANRAGIFQLTRALDFAKIPELMAELAKHWLEIGLTEQAA